MQKREQAFTVLWQRWARNNSDKLPSYFIWEIKVSKDKKSPIPFSAVKEHQIHALMITKYYSFVYKFSDISQLGTPADGIYMHQGAGLLIFNYCGKKFYVIDIDKFEEERDNSKRKSLTEDRAAEIALFVGKLN